MSSLNILSYPQKLTYYVGEELDLTGLRLEFTDDTGKSTYIYPSQIAPGDIWGFSSETVNMNGRLVIWKNGVPAVIHYNVVKKGSSPDDPIIPDDPEPSPTDVISVDELKKVLQYFPLKEEDKDKVLLNLDSLKEWLKGNSPKNLPEEIQSIANQKLTLDRLTEAILSGVFVMNTEDPSEDFKKRSQEILDYFKSLVIDKVFTVSDLVNFAKKTKDTSIGFSTDWLTTLYNTVTSIGEDTDYFNFSAIKSLVVEGILDISNITGLFPSLTAGVAEITGLVQNFIKQKLLSIKDVANLLVQTVNGKKILDIDWLKQNAKEYGFDFEGLQKLLEGVAKGDFTQITDPETLAKIAQGILPDPLDKFSVAATDLIKYPDKGIKELEQTALDWTGGKVELFLQNGAQKVMTVLKGTVIGNFLDTLGLTDIASKGLQTLAVYAKDTLISGIGTLFGLNVKLDPPSAVLQSLSFDVPPEKTVYFLKENLNYDNLSFLATMSDGSTLKLTANDFNFSGFDTSAYQEKVEDFKDLVIKLKDSVSVQNGFKVPRVLTDSEKHLFESRNQTGKKIIRNYYGTILASEEDLSKVVFNYKVLPLVPIEFEITTPPTKNSYILGEEFDISGLVGTVKYNDNETTETIKDTKHFCVVGFHTDDIGTFQAFIYYQKFKATFEYSVREETPVSLYLERVPDAPCFYVGDKININGISVKATYDGIESGVRLPVPAKFLTVPDITFTEKNEAYNVVIGYKGLTVNYNIQVVDYSLTFFQVQAEPLKVSYIPGEKVTLEGMILTGIQMDTTVVQLNEENDEYLLAFYHPKVEVAEYLRKNSSTGEPLSVYNQIVKLSEDEDTDPQPEVAYNNMKISGEPYQDDYWYYMMSSMLETHDYFVSGDPGTYIVYAFTWEKIRDPNRSGTPEDGNWGSFLKTKFTYLLKEEPPNFYGYFVAPSSSLKERYIPGDTIDLQGLVVEARYGLQLPDKTWSINERHILDKGNFDFVYQYEGEGPEETHPLSELLILPEGKTNIQVKIIGTSKVRETEPNTITWNVLLRNAHITGIEINKQSPKIKLTYRYGESFDPTILDIYLTYSDGYQENLDIEKCTFSNIDTSVIKKQKVIVYYMEFSDNYTISIDKGALKCISVRKEPLKMTYYVNENFSTRGMELFAIYDTGYEERIALSDTNLHVVGFYSLRAQKVLHVYLDYKGQRAVINPSVVERGVSYVTLGAPPNKVLYQVGEVATWDGLIVQAHMEDGRTTIVPLSDLTILGFDSAEPYGKIEILVEYLGFEKSFSLSFNVFILPGALKEVLIENMPMKQVYGLYESLDLTGFVARGFCENNPRGFDIPTNVFKITNFDTSTLTGYSDTGEEIVKYYYMSLANQSAIDPIQIPYKVNGNNLKEIYFVPPTCQFIPSEYIKLPEASSAGDHCTVDLIHIPVNGGSVIEVYNVDNNTYNKSVDLSYVLNSPKEWLVHCTGVGDDPENPNVDSVRYMVLEVTKLINETAIRTAQIIYYILNTMTTFSTSYSTIKKLTTPNVLLLGDTPSCQYVSWGFQYRDPDDGSIKADTAYATLDGIDEGDDVVTFDQVGVVFVYPNTTYEHYDKMSFISPVINKYIPTEGENPYFGTRETRSYTVQVIDPGSKPKAVDILSLPNKLEYNLDDQIIDLTGIELVQVYEDQTKYPIEVDDLKVVSFDTASEGTKKVIFSALDGKITLVYDIEVVAVPNALFINCLPNQTIYYNNTYSKPNLEGLELQAQFRDLDSGYVWHQDVPLEDIVVETFSTSGISNTEMVSGSKARRLCSLSWRGARTFFEYDILVSSPVDVDLDLDENGYVLKKQQKIDRMYPTIYLKDVILRYIYPDKSIQEVFLEKVLGEEVIQDIENKIKEEGSNGVDFTYSLFDILKKDFTLHYTLVNGGVYAITCYEGKKTVYNKLYGSNSLDYNFDMDVTVFYSNGEIEKIPISDTTIFDVKKDFLKIGTRVLESGDIAYIKDGFYVLYQQNPDVPTTIKFVYKGIQYVGVLNKGTNYIEAYVDSVIDNSKIELESNNEHWIINNNFDADLDLGENDE